MHENEEFIGALVNMVKKDIDYSKIKYAEKVASGERAVGRKKKLDDQSIWNLAHNENRKSEEIAQILGYSKSSVDHSEGWRRRKEENFGIQLEEEGFSF